MSAPAASPTPDSPEPRRRSYGGLVFGACLIALLGWTALREPAGDDPHLVMREFEGLGTVISVSLYLDETRTAAQANAALDRVEEELRAYQARWSAWGDGELGTLNRDLVAGKAVTIPEALRPLFAMAATRSRLSGGRFDVRVGQLVELWGFDDEIHYRIAPPAADAIERITSELAAAPRLDDAPTHYGPARGVRFDFGAIAKGDAIDQVVDHLRAAGFADAIVNAGGNLRAAGRHGDRPWRIGIRHPRPDEQHRLLATMDIDADEAVVTSGDYERYFEHEGRRYHHLLDPRSGWPASAMQSVTIVAGTAALADGASTALFVAGDEWPMVAAALGLDRVLVVDAQGRVAATPALAARLRYGDGIAAEIVAVPGSP